MLNIVKRNKQINPSLKFIHNWNVNGKSVTYFFNTLSLFFPRGERYFIDAVRHASKQVELTDQQKKDISAFIAQEAFHGREHDVINDAIGLPRVERMVDAALTYLTDNLPNVFNLGATVALEHMTAIMAQVLLEDSDQLLESSEQTFIDLWTWHALEETEHKAVAFDLFAKQKIPNLAKYGIRTSALVLSTAIFILSVVYTYAAMTRMRRDVSLENVLAFVKTMFIKPAFLVKLVPLWLDWFRPGFHPWKHDNKFMLKKYSEFLNS